MRDPLRLWETSKQDARKVWLDDRVIRCAAGVLAIWNPNRDVLVVAPEPATNVQAAVLDVFLAQAGHQSPQEAAAFLDAHWEALVSNRDA